MFDVLINWLSGRLTTTDRIVSALLPLIIIFGYVLISLLVYGVRCLRVGSYVDAELSGRGSSVLVGMWARHFFAWLMQPWWKLLRQTQLPPNAITTLSVLLATASAIALAAGRFAMGGWLYLASGLCDFFDGRLARITGQATPAGAALDSILDRYTDAVVLGGLAWFYRDSWVLLPTLIALFGSLMVSYIRARGEALGIDVKVGLMQRPERIVYLGLPVALSPIVEALYVPSDPRPIHRVAIVAIVFLAVSTLRTSAQRFTYLIGKLGQPTTNLFQLGRGSLFRSMMAAFIATGLDYATVYYWVHRWEWRLWLATAVGCVVGAVVNFSINRLWTFHSVGTPFRQGSRYAFVSVSSAFLNSGGVAIVVLLPSVDWKQSLYWTMGWIIVRVFVYLFWNYPLHRDYVFGSYSTTEAPMQPVSEKTASSGSPLAMQKIESSSVASSGER